MTWHHTDIIPPTVYYVTADRAHIPDHYGYAYCRSNRPFRVAHDVPARVTVCGGCWERHAGTFRPYADQVKHDGNVPVQRDGDRY